MATCDQLIQDELGDLSQHPPTVRESEEVLLSWLGDMAFNTMELCRILNGIQPEAFEGCYPAFSYDTKPDRCLGRCRGCHTHSGAVDKRLRRLQARGLVKSVGIRWFDHRDPGRAGEGSIQLDNFRIYYVSRESLARRLIQDVRINLGDPDYE